MRPPGSTRRSKRRVRAPAAPRERRRREPRASAPDSRARTSRWPAHVAAFVLVLCSAGGLTGVPGIPNPFEEETVDRSGPAVLKSMRDLEELHAATGHFEVVVDLEQDTALPAARSSASGRCSSASGDVDAVIDLAQLDEGTVQVSDDRRRATIRLPQPRDLGDVALDLESSYVYDRRRACSTRSATSSAATRRASARRSSRAKIREAAEGSPELKRAARESAPTLTALLRRSASRTSRS